jgi:hypothetical protein
MHARQQGGHAPQGNPEIAQENMTQLIAAGVPSTYPSLHYPVSETWNGELGIAERAASSELIFQKIWRQRVDIEARSALIQAQIASRKFKAAERSANMLISIIEGQFSCFFTLLTVESSLALIFHFTLE